MAFMQVSFYSDALCREQQVNVVLPQYREPGQQFAALYLLHGLSDDYSAWCRWTSIERYAEAYPIAVIMPDCAESFYCNMKYGRSFYDYIAVELPGIMENMLGLSDKREDRAIAGLSMGGYGALKAGLRSGDRFFAAAAFSPCADLQSRVRQHGGEPYVSIFGEDLTVPPEDDLLKLVEICETRPKIFTAIGKQDYLYENNQSLRKRFEELGYDYTYFESPGRHDWNFWDHYIQVALAWMYGDRQR